MRGRFVSSLLASNQYLKCFQHPIDGIGVAVAPANDALSRIPAAYKCQLDSGAISGAALLRNLDEEAANAGGSRKSRTVVQHGAQHVHALGKTGAIVGFVGKD